MTLLARPHAVDRYGHTLQLYRDELDRVPEDVWSVLGIEFACFDEDDDEDQPNGDQPKGAAHFMRGAKRWVAQTIQERCVGPHWPTVWAWPSGYVMGDRLEPVQPSEPDATRSEARDAVEAVACGAQSLLDALCALPSAAADELAAAGATNLSFILYGFNPQRDYEAQRETFYGLTLREDLHVNYQIRSLSCGPFGAVLRELAALSARMVEVAATNRGGDRPGWTNKQVRGLAWMHGDILDDALSFLDPDDPAEVYLTIDDPIARRDDDPTLDEDKRYQATPGECGGSASTSAIPTTGFVPEIFSSRRWVNSSTSPANSDPTISVAT